MPRVKIDHIVSFSSEDPEYPAASVVSGCAGARGWRCARGAGSAASVVLQLHGAVNISALTVGAVGAATLEIMAARGEAGGEWTCLAPAVVLLPPAASRRLPPGASVTEGARVRSYPAAELAGGAGGQCWDRLRVQLTQPYNQHVQFGLSFIHIYSPEPPGAPPPPPTPPLPLALSDEEEFRPGELFAARLQRAHTPSDSAHTNNVSTTATSAQIKKATAQALKNIDDSSSKLKRSSLFRPTVDASLESAARESVGDKTHRHNVTGDTSAQVKENTRHETGDNTQSRDKQKPRDAALASSPSTSKERRDSHRPQHDSHKRHKTRESSSESNDTSHDSNNSGKTGNDSNDTSNRKTDRGKQSEADSRRQKNRAGGSEPNESRNDPNKRRKTNDSSSGPSDTSNGPTDRGQQTHLESDQRRTSSRQKDRAGSGSAQGGGGTVQRRPTSSRQRDRAGSDSDDGGGQGGMVLHGVVMVLSGYAGSRRQRLKATACAMGADIEPDWGPNCTHLICAFPNTPKLRTALAAGGGAVRAARGEWLEACAAAGQRLPWRWFATRDQDKVQPPDDAHSTTRPPTPEECDTDDEIEAAVRGAATVRPTATDDDKTVSGVAMRSYDDDDEAVYNAVTPPRVMPPPAVLGGGVLPVLFGGCTVAAEPTLSVDTRELQRYVTAYGGHYLQERELSGGLRPAYRLCDAAAAAAAGEGVAVRADWLWRCHEARALLPLPPPTPPPPQPP